MACTYQNNAFCAELTSETRTELCATCQIHRYAKGLKLPTGYWQNRLAVLVSGMAIVGEPSPEDATNIITTGITSIGDLLSTGSFIDWGDPVSSRDIICLLDCTVAVFDERLTQTLFESDINFIKVYFNNVFRHCCVEKTAMMRDVGCQDAYTAVRYVVKHCRDHGTPPLTHEQIALVCNRRRPTVTGILHELVKKEPELFLEQLPEQS